jgi:Caspase domain
LLRDLPATASHIIDAIRWLASKTDNSSTVVFHYAGHENWRPSSSEDGGKEVAIWASDNRLIYEKTVGQELGRVRAAHMWIDFATCRAAGFDEPGMVKSGRVLTYSSTKSEFSYEDPSLHHSVFGWYLIAQGMVNKHADANRDGKVTVEEAFAYSKGRVASYTSNYQHPVMVDKAGGKMLLTIPPKPKPSSKPSPSTQPSSTVPKTCVVICV